MKRHTHRNERQPRIYWRHHQWGRPVVGSSRQAIEELRAAVAEGGIALIAPLTPQQVRMLRIRTNELWADAIGKPVFAAIKELSNLFD
jgi:hypothetical protein